MAKKKPGKGKNRGPQRRHLRSVPAGPAVAEQAEDQELFQALRHALRSEEPLALLMTVAGMLEVTDPRRDPLSQQEGLTLEELVESLIGTPYAETTAALTVMRVLIDDEVLAGRIGRELRQRRHPMPPWITELDQVRVTPEVWFMTHTLGDGDNYTFGAHLPGGGDLTAMVYVDHNLGTVVKDAFLVPQALEEVSESMTQRITDPDQTLTPVDPADARAQVEAAIDHGALMIPPLETDTWPMCRPIVEWLLRTLPGGGSVPEMEQWSQHDKQALAEDFFASRFGAGFDSEDERGLLDSLLWFGSDYNVGGPLRWSVVNVEIVMVDWFPRKVMAPVQYLGLLPDLLRAFIRYAHDRLGIRASLTEQTVAAVGRWEPQYRELIAGERPDGPAAMIAQMLEASGEDPEEFFSRLTDAEDPEALMSELMAHSDRSIAEIMLDHLDGAVGGREALLELDDEPLPDEPFDWAAIPADIHEVVEQMLEWCDRCTQDLFDVANRTAMRRFVARVAAGDPAIFRRRASIVRGAAAVAWVITRVNGTSGAYSGGLPVQDLLAYFDITGSVSQRAETMVRAIGVDSRYQYGVEQLGTPELLTSATRAHLIELRDRYMRQSG